MTWGLLVPPLESIVRGQAICNILQSVIACMDLFVKRSNHISSQKGSEQRSTSCSKWNSGKLDTSFGESTISQAKFVIFSKSITSWSMKPSKSSTIEPQSLYMIPRGSIIRSNQLNAKRRLILRSSLDFEEVQYNVVKLLFNAQQIDWGPIHFVCLRATVHQLI